MHIDMQEDLRSSSPLPVPLSGSFQGSAVVSRTLLGKCYGTQIGRLGVCELTHHWLCSAAVMYAAQAGRGVGAPAGRSVGDVLEQIKIEFNQLTEESIKCQRQRDEFQHKCKASV